MSERERLDVTPRLLPHQRKFVEIASDPRSQSVVTLRAAVGSGKSFALAALCARTLHVQPEARVLCLVPTGMRARYADQLGRAGAPVEVMDRFRFREVLDSRGGKDVWRGGVVTLLSIDFAKQTDVAQSLAEMRWDLVVVDDAQSLSGLREKLLRDVSKTAGRVVLATLPSSVLPEGFAGSRATLVEWRRSEIVDWSGTRLDTLARPIVQECPYTLTVPELTIATAVGELGAAIVKTTPPQGLMSGALSHAFHSSPAALEGVLRRFVLRCEVQDGSRGQREFDEDVDPDDALITGINGANVEEAKRVATRILREIDDVASDSKLIALMNVLRECVSESTPPHRVCIVTDFAATVFYVQAEIEARGMACCELHGGVAIEFRKDVVEEVARDGAILIATRAVLREGVDVRQITDLVFYDLPATEASVEVVLGRFDHIGRTGTLNVHVLVPTNGPRDLLSLRMEILQNVITGEPNE